MNLRWVWAGVYAGALVVGGCSGDFGPGTGDGPGGADGGGENGGDGGRRTGDGGGTGGDGGGTDGGSTTTSGGSGGVTRTRGVGKQMLSVAPDFALAGSDYGYSPRHTLNGDVKWEMLDGPSGMSLEDGRVRWRPGSEQRGDYRVEIRASVGDDQVTQSFNLRVAGLRELAAREMQSGSLSVVSPTSNIRGAGIQIGTGSLAQARTLRISELDDSPRAANARSSFRTVDFGPSGTNFEQPATVTLPFDNSRDYDRSRLGAYTYNTDTGRWERVNVVDVDEDNGVLVARTSHFSIYAAIESALDLEVDVAQMGDDSTCEGTLAARVELTSALSEVPVGSVNSLSETMAALGATTVEELITHAGFHGSLRFVRVVQLHQGEGDDRVTVATRLMVSTLYVDAETGAAWITHTDALGNVIAEREIEDVSAFVTDIDAHMRGLTTQRLLPSLDASQAYAASGRLHIIYSEADASVVGASVDDLGPAAVDAPVGAEGLAAAAAAGIDPDCDGYRSPYDTFDDSLQPRIVATPEEAVTVIEGVSTQLSAQVVDSNGAATNRSWSVEGTGGTLVNVSSGVRSFSASLPGLYTVVFRATADGVQLEKRFQVQVLEAPTVNTPPTCLPALGSNEMTVGGKLGVIADVHDDETPDAALTVQWGFANLEGSEPSLVATGALSAQGLTARFTPPTEGTFYIGCRAHDGTEAGPVGYAAVAALPQAINRSPRDFRLSPLAKDVVVGGSVAFNASATDPDGDTLTFTWAGLPSGTTAQTNGSGTSKLTVNTTSVPPGLYTVRVTVSDGVNPGLEIEGSLLVLAQSIDPNELDEDDDGFPASVDCNDNDRTIHPQALEICGDPGDVDENCDGEARVEDCDGDGFASIAQGGTDCNDADRKIGPQAQELCDGIDNDCNGEVDDGFDVGLSCEVGTGACLDEGTVLCTPNGAQSLCEGTPGAASAEVCDGIDNDCDADLSDDAAACESEKVGLWWRCTDDLCTGLVDEGILLLADGTFQNLSAPLGVETFDPASEASCGYEQGSWESTGIDTLTVYTSDDQGPIQVDVTVTSIGNGQMTLEFYDPGNQAGVTEHYLLLDGSPATPASECDFDVRCTPMPEMCNDLDDDCDFAIDEEGVCDGFCFCDTSAACDGDPLPCPCDADCGTPACSPVSEMCDGVDNDCDGGIDENGVCDASMSSGDEAVGFWFFCVDAGCTALDNTGFMLLDDGSMFFLHPENKDDNNYDPAKPYCVEGDGSWERVSASQIQLDWIEGSGDPISLLVDTSQDGDFWHWAYTDPDSGSPEETNLAPVGPNSAGACSFGGQDCSGPEVCNGWDDDCDGEIDEGFDVGPEVCDGADNDCDGLVDNLPPQPCSVPDGMGRCALGQNGCSGLVEECQPLYAPAAQNEEFCDDGLDTDCDGDASPTEDLCTATPAGEHCASATPVGSGGVFHGDLAGALDLVGNFCNTPEYGGLPEHATLPEHVYRLDVPAGGRNVFFNARATTPPLCNGDGQDNDDDGLVDEVDEPCDPWKAQESLGISVLASTCTPNDAWCIRGSEVRSSWFDEGSYFLVVESKYGPVEYDLAVAMDEAGGCTLQDLDVDGSTLCDYDCAEGDPAVHEGAVELCDGIDNDCNGGVDDVYGSCVVAGVEGACAVGRGYCGESGLVCEQLTFPAPDEYCGDGVDNDCDGQTDAADPGGCVTLAEGELCGLAQPLVLGGNYAGTLTGALDNAQVRCGKSDDPELYYSFELAQPTEVVLGVQVLGCSCDVDPNNCDGTCACDPLCVPACACDLEPGVCDDCGCDPDCGGSTSNGGGELGVSWVLSQGSCDDAALDQAGCEWSGGTRYWSLPAGTHFLTVQGPEGTDYEITLASYDQGGNCVPGDADVDGYTVCDGDCAEGDPSRHPGATEACNGLDDDCNGLVDDLQGTCTVGTEPGVCNQGQLVCDQGGPVCQQVTFPGDLQEICADGIDNDCDGSLDEAGDCLALVPGDRCEMAIPVSGTSATSASLFGALDDVDQGCGPGNYPEVFFTFEVPNFGAGESVRTVIQTLVPPGQDPSGLEVEVLRGPACEGEGWGCLWGGFDEWWLDPGTWTLVVSGPNGVDVDVRVAFEDPELGSCSQGDVDGDGLSLCEGDCNEGDVLVFPGQVELCDGIDNDCNQDVDDVKGPCTIPTLDGLCAQGVRACVGASETCEQVNFPVEEYCADGVDNDCDGTVDAADPGGCTTLPPGAICALPIDVSGGGVFGLDLATAMTDEDLGCTDGPEVYFEFTLAQGGNVSWQVREAASGAPANDVYVTVFSDLGCTEPSYCTDPTWGGNFDGGTHRIAVEGSSASPLELVVGFDDGVGGCLPGDGDGDDWTLCQLDCNDGDPDVHPGATEMCDGKDNDCNGQVDDLYGECFSTGLPGVCGKGHWTCEGMTQTCVEDVAPGSQPDLCANGLDDDCDGQIDEGDCTVPVPGDFCEVADLLPQGQISFTMNGTKNYDSPCEGFDPSRVDHVFSFQVPVGGAWVDIANYGGSGDTRFDFYRGVCGELLHDSCAYPDGPQWLWDGDYLLVVTDFLDADVDFEVFITPPQCGDFQLDPSEQCDDGNTFSGDGCSSACTWEAGFEDDEVACSDGLDNDGDGDIDCADPDCMATAVCGAGGGDGGAGFCGDGFCDFGPEDPGICPVDCGGPEDDDGACSDGFDNDGDGDIDCADPGCMATAICGGGGDGGV